MSNRVDPSWRPDESSADIFAEHTWLQGAFLTAIAFGMEFILYVMTCYFLWTRRDPINKRQNTFLMCYISIIFVLSVLTMGSMLEFTQLSFIDGRIIPGGPATFENQMFSLPIDNLGNVVIVLTSWFCDIINVWRCFVIYKPCRVPSWVVNIVPILLYLGSVAFGILLLKQVSAVSGSPWDASGINFIIPYYSMVLALNILVTALIVLRLLFYRHHIVRALGKNFGHQYASLATVIVESATIYSTFSLLFLVPFASNSPVAQLFLQPLSTVQCVSTFLIIFRVAIGKGWSTETYANVMHSSFRASETIGGSTNPRSKKNSSLSSNALASYNREGTGNEAIMLGAVKSPSNWFDGKKDSVDGIEISTFVERSKV
ncbi:hypothetical protein AN958_08981 [Leucoagaricus sp. SymC.cos]|nr:hypothetical protein AN958_08981 [Leucoagaricus sp. SymC.cos]